MEANKFLQEYLDNNEALHAEVKGRKGAEDTLISIKDVNVILERQRLDFYKKLFKKLNKIFKESNNLVIYMFEIKKKIELLDPEWKNDEILE